MQTFLSNYITSILTVGICAFLCEAISGFKGCAKLSDAMKFISTLCVFTAVLIPFGISVKNIDKSKFKATFPNAAIQNNSYESFDTLVEKETAKKIKEEIIKITKTHPKEVFTELDKNTFEIVSVTIITDGIQDEAFYEKAKEAINEMFEKEVTVIYDNGKEEN